MAQISNNGIDQHHLQVTDTNVQSTQYKHLLSNTSDQGCDNMLFVMKPQPPQFKSYNN